MRQEIRVNFTGETTLDNGVTVGILVGLNGENVAKSGIGSIASFLPAATTRRGYSD
jgi:hypothetical protein